MKNFCFFLICWALASFTNHSFARDTTQIERAELRLIDLYHEFWNPNTTSFKHQYELIPQFRKEMEELLLQPNSFDHQFVALAKNIKIRVSPDKRLRVFSWDDNSHPYWRHICSLAQFIDDKGKVHTRWLSVGDEFLTSEFTDVWIYGIHELGEGKDKRYMTIGEGTHGEGLHHLTIQLFDINGKDLLRCQNCFEIGEEYLVVQAVLIDHFNLMYNEEDMEISYSTFERDEASGFYIKTGERTKLRYNGASFRIVKKKSY
jgi:hypothetical protein